VINALLVSELTAMPDAVVLSSSVVVLPPGNHTRDDPGRAPTDDVKQINKAVLDCLFYVRMILVCV